MSRQAGSLRALAAALVLGTAGLVAAAAPARAATIGVTISPKAGRPGTAVTVNASGFDPYSLIDLYFDTTDVESVPADAKGNVVAAMLTVPASATPVSHWISAVEEGDHPRGAQQSFRVATNWGQFGFNAAHTGVNPYENVLSPQTVPDLDEDWATPTGGALDLATPAVDGAAGSSGLVYVGQSTGPNRLVALNAQTGAPVWTSTEAGPFDTPAVSGNKVWVVRYLTLETYSTTCSTSTCAATGGSKVGGQSSAPTISDGSVYTADRYLGLDAFPATCGAECSPIWTGDANGDILGLPGTSGAPAVAGSRVFAIERGIGGPYPSTMLAAYSTASCSAGSCAPTWYAPLAGSSTSTAVANGVVYVNAGGALQAYRAAGCPTSPCSPQWSFAIGAPTAVSPAVSDGVVYVPGEDANTSTYWLYALDAGTGGLIWQGQLSHVNGESSPVVANGVVYVNADDSFSSGELYAFPTSCPATCGQIWHAVDSSNGYSSAPVVVNGTVYAASGNGDLYAYAPDPH